MGVADSSPCLHIQLCKRTTVETSVSFYFIHTRINLKGNVLQSCRLLFIYMDKKYFFVVFNILLHRIFFRLAYLDYNVHKTRFRKNFRGFYSFM